MQRGALVRAAEATLLRTSRLRADTTVLPADVAYPIDSGLLAKAVRRIAAAGQRVLAAGGATRTRLRDRSRSAGARARAIGAKLRLRGAQARDEASWPGSLNAAAEAEKLLVTPAGPCAQVASQPRTRGSARRTRPW